MSWYDWLIMLIPVAFVVYMGYYSCRYIKGVSDYLAAGRVAGRYVILVGDISQGLAVITLIGYVEASYKTGFALSFWNNLLLPLGIIIGLTGFCTYRFRETKAMSLGQFLEMRYNRSLRIYASALRSMAELLANCMCPALAARFMIYYLGLPYSFSLFGLQIPTFLVLTFVVISLCVIICYQGGCLSLLVTDTIQGFFCYPLLILFTVFIACKFSWYEVVLPVMGDRVSGQSFLDPFDIKELRDFNLFALVVTIYSTIVNRANWMGTGSTIAARSPHEQKIAAIMGTWRQAFSAVLYILLVIVVIASLNHSSFAKQAKVIRDDLSSQVLQEVARENPAVQKSIEDKIRKMPPRDHQIGGKRPQDKPLSHDENLDTPHLDVVHQELKTLDNGEKRYQEFFTLYHQMMLPVTLKHILPAGMLGLFGLFILLMMLSTDDSRLFSAAQTISQDCVMPFLRKGFTPKEHVTAIRLTVICCGIFWFIGSFFMAQLDYVNMVVTIICTMWIGAGPMMLFGLYSRFGNTAGAFSSLITGMTASLSFIFLQRNWASIIYPFLERQQLVEKVGALLAQASAPFEPWIVWRMSPHKFPVNSMEINFFIMLLSLAVYVSVSLITYKGPFNLDRLLHRGKYNVDGDPKEYFEWSFRNAFKKLIGITSEFTLGDKIISLSIFLYSVVFCFLGTFVGVVIWNWISPWSLEWWGNYFLIVCLIVPTICALIATFWFVIGGISDMKQLFKDLQKRIDDPLDNGQVEGEVSLADRDKFEKQENASK